ncbi:hypothetical protein Acr_00g0069580 [Actinidia rufa]|uniref:CCHC-type domain-containing protein n=1 Tax=Actinidia rufa TaxID=165716 RepID=A0A7J0DRK3_9ERIC|nr:hypothetical protein Acr_00g0069580 [Actinidia rufa]
MPPRRGRGRRGAAEPEDRVDRIERILEGLVFKWREGLKLDYDGTSRIKVEILRLPTHQEVLHAALIAEESLNEMSQFRENRKKRIGGNVSRGQSSKRQSSGSSSGNSSAQQRNVYRACYGCGQEGHQIRDCPMRKRIQGAGTSASASVQQPPTERRNNQPRQGRAFALVPGNTPATTSVVSGMDWLSSYRALIDCELKRVVFHSFAHSGLIFEGVGVVPPPYLIFFYESRVA